MELIINKPVWYEYTWTPWNSASVCACVCVLHMKLLVIFGLVCAENIHLPVSSACTSLIVRLSLPIFSDERLQRSLVMRLNSCSCQLMYTPSQGGGGSGGRVCDGDAGGQRQQPQDGAQGRQVTRSADNCSLDHFSRLGIIRKQFHM